MVHQWGPFLVVCKPTNFVRNSVGTFHLLEDKDGLKILCNTTCSEYNRSNLKRPHHRALKLLSSTDDSIVMLQIEMTLAILWARKPILAMAWPFSGVGFHLVSWWRALYGPPALGVWTSKTLDCKVDGAHMQPGKRHHAGDKWHLNTQCILGAWLST